MVDRKKSGKSEKGTMSVQEAGRRGGQRTSQTHGRDFMKKSAAKEARKSGS
jgi:hypothetical protein